MPVPLAQPRSAVSDSAVRGAQSKKALPARPAEPTITPVTLPGPDQSRTSSLRSSAIKFSSTALPNSFEQGKRRRIDSGPTLRSSSIERPPKPDPEARFDSPDEDPTGVSAGQEQQEPSEETSGEAEAAHIATSEIPKRPAETELSEKEASPAQGSKGLCCPICGINHTCSSKLKRHLVIHSKSKPFPCQFCPSRYSSSISRGSFPWLISQGSHLCNCSDHLVCLA
eukprot:m.653910 g.653910  ORF g.653910 m.653910 type:complete len:226 (-) comp58408_c1_seq16:3-680(-)